MIDKYIFEMHSDPWSFLYHLMHDKPVPANDNRKES